MGSASFSFDEAFNVMAQGKAYSYITYNFFRAGIDDASKSAVVGKVEIIPVPGKEAGQGGSLNGVAVNGKRVGEADLQDGDAITVGRVLLQYIERS